MEIYVFEAYKCVVGMSTYCRTSIDLAVGVSVNVEYRCLASYCKFGFNPSCLVQGKLLC